MNRKLLDALATTINAIACVNPAVLIGTAALVLCVGVAVAAAVAGVDLAAIRLH
jgi:hypothetical protein